MRFNMEVNVIFPYAFSKRSRLKQSVHDLYRQTSAHETSRHAIWMYGKELIDSSEWYDSLWAKRDAIRDIPALIVWGMKDPVFNALLPTEVAIAVHGWADSRTGRCGPLRPGGSAGGRL